MTPKDAARYVAWCEALLDDLRACPIHRWYARGSQRRDGVLQKALGAAKHRTGPILEFGVYQGVSLRMMAAKLPTRKFYGFDSFEGFPDDGRPDWDLDFDVIEMPQMPENVTLLKGWFSQTLPGFLSEHPPEMALLHVDCDLYSSARDVFDLLGDSGWLQPGLVIVFDELINYREFAWNETLALWQVLERLGFGARALAAHDKVRSLADTLKLVEDGGGVSWEVDQKQGYRQQAAIVLTDRPAIPGEADPETLARFLRLSTARDQA